MGGCARRGESFCGFEPRVETSVPVLDGVVTGSWAVVVDQVVAIVVDAVTDFAGLRFKGCTGR